MGFILVSVLVTKISLLYAGLSFWRSSDQDQGHSGNTKFCNSRRVKLPSAITLDL